ncbi:MAG: DUF429 domain-containing protein [Candidatus Altiarchaeales archaeon]|nr:DUF429 domain-containing protein [Candidatus Altiarchaeota archaeon]MBU4341922.1 DUF429 domain-containing protein [Candidatus Altiarchaeota archaeon]MBU4406546.1 DUF429 domain-containing protein [Candidatus Altiarchaeota archaeon]MBU4437742.1 DUF429 domain-containing protein [Candidatus Altiarchaeota archaeon]MCG2783094.1 DUF429 domain-containing protein [Candidatus Altiarchaeales archaeon]
MKIVGIDLAGNPTNDTGFCVLRVADDEKSVSTSILKSDSEILERLNEIQPEIVAIDAPLIFEGRNRPCDDELGEYGALPVTLRGMEVLAKRGSSLAIEIKKFNPNLIEISAKTSAKILGFHDPDNKKMQKRLIEAKISGDIDKRFLTKDELDAIFAAITGYLHLNGSTEEVGDDNGKIVIPKV